MKTTEIGMPFSSEQFKAAWDEWIEFRRQSRFKKYVPIGLQKTLTALARDSGNHEETAILIIQQSIERNWQGLFPLKSNNNGSNQNSSNQSNGAFNGRNGGFQILADQLKEKLTAGRATDINYEI